VYSKKLPLSLQHLLPKGVIWIDESEVAALARENKVNVIILQGSAAFCEHVLWSFGQDLNSESLFVLIPAERLRIFKRLVSRCTKWYKIKHASIGGVSTSKWLIGVGKSKGYNNFPTLEKLCATFGLKRQFIDIVKTATRGKACEPSDKVMPKLVDLKEVLQRTEWLVPSVMASTGWVRRKLTLQELGSIFDFPELFISRIVEDEVIDAITDLNYVFNPSTIPLKVCNVLKCLIGSKYNTGEPILEVREVLEPDVIIAETGVNFQSGLLQDSEGGDMNHTSITSSTTDYLKSYGEKVAKSDDATVPVELWNYVLFEKYFSHILYSPIKHGRALEVIRNKFALRIYTINVVSSFFKYIKEKHGNAWLSNYLITRKCRRAGLGYNRKRGWRLKLEKHQELRSDLIIGLEGLLRVIQGSWWEWNFGSTLFFWRWPMQIRSAARDGVSVFIQSELPRYRRRQRPPGKEYMLIKMKEKLSKVRKRKYISKGPVRSLINCFAVEKGSEDIRLVYDGSKSGLNDAVFSPNFFLPFPDSLLMWINADTWMADLDLGEMFLNYFLDKRVRGYSGVDLTKFLEADEEFKNTWERWCRTFMGFTFSPFSSCKLFGWTVDVIYGDRWDKLNPYRWDRVRLNFPGSANYNPTQPRLCKMIGELIAAILEVFVDDIRTLGATMERCRNATRRASQILQYLGQQDAARKYRPPHTTPGPWCGSFVAIRDRCVWLYVSQEKWEKAKLFVQEL
jgi:hypothetical protein